MSANRIFWLLTVLSLAQSDCIKTWYWMQWARLDRNFYSAGSFCECLQFSGPTNPGFPGCQTRFDYSLDGDVDLQDFAVIQASPPVPTTQPAPGVRT